MGGGGVDRCGRLKDSDAQLREEERRKVAWVRVRREEKVVNGRAFVSQRELELTGGMQEGGAAPLTYKHMDESRVTRGWGFSGLKGQRTPSPSPRKPHQNRIKEGHRGGEEPRGMSGPGNAMDGQ